jgi:hypothetical protein
MTRQDPGDFDPRDSMIPPNGCLPPFFVLVVMAAFAALCLFVAWPAFAHEATNTAGQPTGWAYGWECCSATDCAPLPARDVEQTPTGYRVTVRPGDHPFITEAVGVKVYEIPYDSKKIKTSKDGGYHLCLRPGTSKAEGEYSALNLICFYKGPEGF